MTYKLLKNGESILSDIAGQYAGWKPGKIFGKITCDSGKRMKKENRVFFANLEDAVKEGYRPCHQCRPIGEKEFEQIKHLVPQFNSVKDFYNSGYGHKK